MSKSVVIDRTVELIQDRLNLNTLQQKVTAGNLANINTPGYVARELSFESVFRKSLEDEVLHMVRSHGKHMDPADGRSALHSPKIVESGPVDLDQQMVKLTQNSIEYQYMVTLLNKKLSDLKLAIDEGGR